MGRLSIGEEQHVVKKTVGTIPQLDVLSAHVIYRAADVDEMLEEFAGDILVRSILPRKFQRHRQHVETVHAHPAGGVGLFETAPGRKRRASIKHADVVEAEESALKNIFPFRIFPVDPPGEVQQELVKYPFEKRSVADPFAFL